MEKEYYMNVDEKESNRNLSMAFNKNWKKLKKYKFNKRKNKPGEHDRQIAETMYCIAMVISVGVGTPFENRNLISGRS